MSERWTEAKVFACLHKVFPNGAYVLLPQVRNGIGHYCKQTRTADAIAVSCWPSRGLYLAGVEIKVSLSDWRSELANAEKAEDMAQYCKLWYIAAPKGVIPAGELPDDWGLIECEERQSKIVKAAKATEFQPIDFPLMAAILRVVSQVTTPTDNVRDKITEGIEAARRVDAQAHKREIEELETLVGRFEEASGVDLRGAKWRAGRIGEAVKQAMKSSKINVDYQLRSIAQTANRILECIPIELREGKPNA